MDLCWRRLPPVHVLEALEAEVVLAISTEDLWTLHSTRGAKAAASCGEGGVGLARALASFVQGIEAGLTEGHEALIALQSRLHDATRLARNLQVSEVLVEKHVRLREEQPVHGGLRPQHQEIQSLALQYLQVPLGEWVFNGEVVVHRVVEVHDAGLALAHRSIWWHGRG